MFRKKDSVDLDISVFRVNSRDYLLTNSFVLLNVLILMNSLNKMNKDMRIFTFAIFNILLTLLLFLAASQIKNYHNRWSYVVIISGLFQLIRLTIMPVNTASKYVIFLYVLSGLIGILTGLSSLKKSKERQAYINEIGGLS